MLLREGTIFSRFLSWVICSTFFFLIRPPKSIIIQLDFPIIPSIDFIVAEFVFFTLNEDVLTNTLFIKKKEKIHES